MAPSGHRSWASFGAMCLVASLSIAASPAKPRVTGLFSNMHWVEEAGDVYGYEVLIVSTGDAYFATFQEAQGRPDRPVVVSVCVSGTSIEFEIPDSDGPRKFRGTVSAKALVGGFQGSAEKLVLQRGKSYWQ